MKRKKIIKKLKLTQDDFTAVKDSVAQAENNTSGEIAVAIIGESSDYSFHELFAALIFGAIVFSLLLPFHHSIGNLLDRFFWEVPEWVHAAIYGTTGFFATALFFAFANIPIIDRLVIPRRVRTHAVYTRALRHFVESGVYATRERTGILIFISLMEHEVRILADNGISEKIDQSTWNTLANTIALGVREGKTASVLVEGIGECGRILAEYFPAQEENKNELADGLILLESGI
ncbi:MAG TPA: hypothetical protein GXZ47_03170 [Treponema sp.]|nr:hypothetical protein [Treponema sp.]